MGTMGGFDAEAGWYPDPLDRGAHRYWDGDAWTDQVVRAVPDGVDVDEGLHRARSARLLALATTAPVVDQGAADRGRAERMARWAWVMSALAVLGGAFLIVGLVAAGDQGVTQLADAPATTADQPDGATLTPREAPLVPATTGGRAGDTSRLAPIPSAPPLAPGPPLTTPATATTAAPSGAGVATPSTTPAADVAASHGASTAAAPAPAPLPPPAAVSSPPATAAAATPGPAAQVPPTTAGASAPSAPSDAPGPQSTATTAAAARAGAKSAGPMASTRVVITGTVGCSPHYDGCVPVALDVDCAGTGDGPAFFAGTAQVLDVDVYGLDGDGDGIACN